MNTTEEALGLVFAMGAVIFFCRAFPFLLFLKTNNAGDPNADDTAGGESISGDKKRSSRAAAFFGFVEKSVPPVVMTVLAFNALGEAFRENPMDGLWVLAASVFTAVLHLWKSNALISIFGGTALYMILLRII